ncbi:MAG TPA: hypothetical protein VFP77_12045 [Gemmatimonadaceae bacterium]|nr:hypothetical protein [Gemmatimonadaceae bacterium]
MFLRIDIDQNQYDAMMTAFDDRVYHPGRYNMMGNACPGFVEDVLRAGGIDVGDHLFPRALWGELNRRYGGR